MDFDAITVDDLRAAGSNKWNRNGAALGAFVAEMDFGLAPVIAQALHELVDKATFGYLPDKIDAELCQATADFHRNRYGWDVNPAWVTPIPDVLKGFDYAMNFFSDTSGRVLLPTPAYMPFLTLPGLSGREVIEIPMLQNGDGWLFDFDAIESQFQEGDLFVLCNPHNPIGKVCTREELQRISEIVSAHNGRVFADEIHAPLVYAPHKHVSYASINDEAASHAITSTAASKAFNLAGLKCAQLILSNQKDVDEWAPMRSMVSHGTGTPGIVASTVAYRDGGPWLDEVLEYLDNNRRLISDLVTTHLPGVRYAQPEGTYLAWLDCTELGLEDPCTFFLNEARVALIPGQACGRAGRCFVRVNFATPRPILEQIFTQMGDALFRRNDQPD